MGPIVILDAGVIVSAAAFSAMLAAERAGHILRAETLHQTYLDVLLDPGMNAADALAFVRHYSAIRAAVRVPTASDVRPVPGPVGSSIPERRPL